MSSEQELSNKVATLTRQLESLTKQFTTLKKEAVLEVSAQTAQSVQSSQKALIAELKETVENGVKNNQKLLIGKIELEEEKSGMAKRDWIQILSSLLTPIIAITLGFLFGKSKATFSKRLLNKKELLPRNCPLPKNFTKGS